ncbi:uncharacterized protein METZ01_LOCUS358099 [marine metagenome]|uniref:Uncharacterized protein n=1 Tax=marine metagenome TaxID=408172 RepID=A0A382S726_9ZZZZ
MLFNPLKMIKIFFKWCGAMVRGLGGKRRSAGNLPK